MNRNHADNTELNISGLLALKAYERPHADRAEKNIQNIMRTVRTTGNSPSPLLPDKNFAWMFAQPRYGVAALFILFLGLHLLDRPIPVEHISSVSLEPLNQAASAVTAVDTNQFKAPVPGVVPQTFYSSPSVFSSGGAEPLLTSYNE